MNNEQDDLIHSCGVIVFRQRPTFSFLLLRHHDRWDLPKGHVDPGESDFECAMRELEEETGIGQSSISIDDSFRFDFRYEVKLKRNNFAPRPKLLTLFLGILSQEDFPIHVTEHIDYEWFDWDPPHQIQAQTIDAVLANAESHFRRSGPPPVGR